jgi:hypothetical protein
MDMQEGQDARPTEVAPPEAPTVQPTMAAPANAVEQSSSGSGTEVIAPTPSFTWQASEYVFHEKPSGWYLILWGVVAVVALILGLLRQWLGIVVVVMMALAVVMYSRKEPRTLTYSLDDKGISIDGRVSSYNLFRSYSVHQEVGWMEIDWEPTRRFAPRLTILCEQGDFDQIEAIVASHLPHLDREHDWVEQLARYLKF